MKHTIKATIYDRKGQIVSQAENSYKKTHPLQAMYASQCGEPYKVYLHAELAALVKSKGKGHKMVIERYNSNGEPRLAAPCPICQMAIAASAIKLVEYTT
jgi:deoxycytidylate deaminase